MLLLLSKLQAISNNNKSKKVQNKPKFQGSIAGSASPPNLRTRNRKDQAANEAVTASETHSISASESSLTSPPSLSTNRSRLPNSKQIAKYPERRNEQRSHCKSRVSESCKEGRRQNNVAKKVSDTPKHGNDISRKKGVKNIDVRSSSGIGNLTVRVAS